MEFTPEEWRDLNHAVSKIKLQGIDIPQIRKNKSDDGYAAYRQEQIGGKAVAIPSGTLHQRDAGGPITICHPVTGERGWVPGYWTVLSVTLG